MDIPWRWHDAAAATWIFRGDQHHRRYWLRSLVSDYKSVLAKVEAIVVAQREIYVARGGLDNNTALLNGFYEFDAADVGRLGKTYNRAWVFAHPRSPLGGRVPGAALNAATEWSRADAEYVNERGVTIIDNALSRTALEGILEFCRSATVFFETKPHNAGGHLGARPRGDPSRRRRGREPHRPRVAATPRPQAESSASRGDAAAANRIVPGRGDAAAAGLPAGAYAVDGFTAPIILQIAEEIKAALPRSLAGLQLLNFWAYKYQHAEPGISAHRDQAAMNVNGSVRHLTALAVSNPRTSQVNLWISPDAGNLEPDRGGLLVYHGGVAGCAEKNRAGPRTIRVAAAAATRPAAQVQTRDGMTPAELRGPSGEEALRDLPQTRVPFRQNRIALFDTKLLSVR